MKSVVTLVIIEEHDDSSCVSCIKNQSHAVCNLMSCAKVCLLPSCMFVADRTRLVKNQY
ncbi:unnamed protein product [Amoebophrya sp. A25]|nr:unnamed protein product [Amoebophrya sp. A25]|eukprot:GSA25T00016823001.1